MKQKIIKNKNKILVAIALTFSLSGVAVFAEVVGSDTQLESVNQEANEGSNQLIKFTEEDKITVYSVLAEEESSLLEKQTDIDSAYQEKLAQIDKKIVPIQYKDINFGNIGELSAKDVHIGISTASDFVNIRETANPEGNILGKLYTNEAVAVLSIENGWAQIESGSVKGYVTTDYLNIDLTKDEVIQNYGSLKATSTVDGLNVRQEADENSQVLTVVSANEKNNLLEVLDGWVKISVPSNGIEGYISSEFADLSVSFKQAISIEEEQEIIRQEEAARKAAEEAAARKAAEEAAKKAAEEAATKKAAEEAAAKKAAEEAAAKKVATPASPAPTKASQPAPVSNSGGSEAAAKEEIARRESGGNYNATNGKYIGRYQLSSSYLNGDHSPENQERVADNYVANRYGSWQNALAFWNNNGWY